MRKRFRIVIKDDMIDTINISLIYLTFILKYDILLYITNVTQWVCMHAYL